MVQNEISQPTQSASPFRPVTGEFRDAAEEEAYSRSIWGEASKHLRQDYTLATGGIFLFGVLDFMALGLNRGFLCITLCRLIALIPFAVSWRLSRQFENRRLLDRIYVANILWYAVIISAVAAFNPAAHAYVMVMSVILVLSVSILEIVRFSLTIVAAVGASLIILSALIATSRYSSADLVAESLTLAVSCVLGRTVAVRAVRLSRRNYALLRELTLLAATDSLTKALSRREFLYRAKMETQLSRRSERPLSLLILDVDHFKSINDRHGHAAGDAALIALVQAMTSTLRASQCVGRLGGEEFGVLLPDTGERGLVLAAERIRSRVAGLLVPLPDGSLRFTVSIGAAALSAADRNVESLIERADKALYKAKHSGRNRVGIAKSPEDYAREAVAASVAQVDEQAP